MNSSGAVLVVTADSIPGLTAIRSLGRNGVRVYGAYRAGLGVGTYSRYCLGSLLLPDGSDEALEQIACYCAAHGISHIMGIEERDIPFLNCARSRLEPRITVLCPPQEAFSSALHKDRTLGLARQCGVPVPRTVYPLRAADIEECATLRFPVILKPTHRDSREGWRPIFNLKSERVENLCDLRSKLEEYERCGELPMIQEFAAGCGVGVSVLMHRQEVQQLFQHRRLREWPLEGGVSVFAESVPLDERLAAESVALLRAMQWEGAAMVEYRVDPDTGSHVLMEVNGRFWGSLPLACAAGADFPFLLYRSSSCEQTSTPYRIGVRARDLPGDTRWLIAALRKKKGKRLASLAAYFRAFGTGVYYYVWSPADPLPALMHIVLACLRRLPRWLRTPDTPHFYERGGKAS